MPAEAQPPTISPWLKRCRVKDSLRWIEAQQAHIPLLDQQHTRWQVIAVVQRLARVEPQWLQQSLADAGERLPTIDLGCGCWLSMLKI